MLIKHTYRTILAILMFFNYASIFAQSGKTSITEKDYANDAIPMADLFRQEGKIYVVLAVILTIFLGIIFFLFLLEKKITSLEKLAHQLNHKQNP